MTSYFTEMTEYEREVQRRLRRGMVMEIIGCAVITAIGAVMVVLMMAM